jgi:pimeloyl-ACP methyl ester carboxylesterase
MIACDPALNTLDLMNRAALLQAGFIERTVDSAAGRQTWFEAGTGDTLVLLHGAGDHAGSWAKVAPVLRERFHLVVPDMAGRGSSEPLEGRISMEAILAGMDAVLGPHGELILIGNSLGAWAAMVWAAAHRDRVRRIVAVNGGPVRGLGSDLTLTPANREEARRLWQAMTYEANHIVPDLVLDELVRKGQVGALGRMSIEDFAPYLMDDRLAEIQAPVDLVWGESDRLLPLEYARLLTEKLPRARLTTIPQCGHIPHLECPRKFLAVLDRLLGEPA